MTSRRIIFFALLLVAVALFGGRNVVRAWLRSPTADVYAALTAPHPTRGHVLKPNAQKIVPVGLYGEFAESWRRSGAKWTARINPQGYRDRPFGPKTGPRIVALGDSSTFGWDVAADETWPKVLERALAASDRPMEVLNLGTPGYSTQQGLLSLPEVWAQQPDLLIVAFGHNDESAAPVDRAGKTPTDSELMPGLAPETAEHLADRRREIGLVGPARRQPQKTGPPDDPSKAFEAIRRVPPERFSENLRVFVDEARAHGVGVVLVNIGSVDDQYRQAVLAVAREVGVPAINTLPLLFSKVEAIKTDPAYASCRSPLLQELGAATLDRSKNGWLWFSTDLTHPNACGHQVIAEALAPLVAAAMKREAGRPKG